jgi:hypothetical protein
MLPGAVMVRGTRGMNGGGAVGGGGGGGGNVALGGVLGGVFGGGFVVLGGDLCGGGVVDLGGVVPVCVCPPVWPLGAPVPLGPAEGPVVFWGLD